MFTEKQREIISECGQYTHQIWKEAYAEKVGEAFGFKLKTWVFKNQPTVPKGAHLSDDEGKPLDQVVGVDSEGVLSQIARHLGYKFSSRTLEYFGRGTRVSAMAGELWKHLEEQVPTTTP